jgi:hypothetical protein
MKRKFCILALCLAVIDFSLEAQTMVQARTWYSQKEYLKALPVFRKELKTKPKDPNLNLWYGASLFETGKTYDALPYLVFAREKGIPDAEFYLAEYLLKREAPDSALVLINHYLGNPSIDIAHKDAAIELKSSIESVLANLQKVEDITIIDSVIVLKSALYSTVKLSSDAGRIAPARPTFPNVPKASGAAYLPEKDDKALYADQLPGKGLEIVVRHRLLNDWDDEEPLSDIINSVSDELNPWLLSDGTTLYFASNRPGSLGGLDLYVTRMGKNDTYLLPDHLNMPFNSNSNDYFLLIDEFTNRGYLATDRNQPKGYAAIYTFIPNTTTVLVQGKSLKELHDLAAIRSIQATWAGKDMEALLKQPEKPVLMTHSDQSGMVFVLNDEFSCYNENDFVSPEARDLFRTYQKEHERFLEATETLQQMRETYLNSDAKKQAELSGKILKLESDMLSLKQELPELETLIRNTELSVRLK